MKRKVRILSVMLALLLCCSSFPFVSSADTLLFECETQMSGSVGSGIAEGEGLSGGKMVSTIGCDGAYWFTMSGVTVAAAGLYTLEVDYTACADGRTFRVGANGTEGTAGALVKAPPLSDWAAIGTATTVIYLNQGENTLKFYSVDSKQNQGDSAWCPSMDCIRIAPLSLTMPDEGLLYECETNLIQHNGTGVGEGEGLSGGKKVTAVGFNGAHWFVLGDIVVPTAGEYTLEVNYTACADGRTFRVGVNGAEGVLVEASNLDSWEAIGTATATVSLQQGSNTLKFYSLPVENDQGDSEYCPDFDCVRIKPVASSDPCDEAAAQVIALISSIGEVTSENYTTALTAIEAAEAALADLVANYGEAARAEVTNAAELTAARESYNSFYFNAIKPELTNGYRLYEAEAETSVFYSTAAVANELSSGGYSVGPVGMGTTNFLMTGIVVPADGVYLVEVYYSACVEPTGRSFRIGVGDGDGNLIVAPGNLDSPYTVGMVAVPLSLKAGSNTLRFYSESTTLNLGDTAFGPDIDCIKVYEDPNVARAELVAQVVDLINAIGEIDETNFLSCLPALQAAEAAMEQLEAVYGEEIRSEVSNYNALIFAREDYDFYNKPTEEDGYIVYQCENLIHTVLNGAYVGIGKIVSIAPNGETGFTMSLEVEEDGWYDMMVGYVNGDPEARICNLEINGKAMTICYPSSGDWASTGVVYLSAELSAGVNTFTFSTPVTDIEYEPAKGFGPDFDYFGIMELPFTNPVPNGTVFGAGTATLTGGLSLEEDDFAVDGKCIAGFGGSGQKASFALTVPSDGFYRIGVEASSIDSNSQSLKLTLAGTDITLPSVTVDSSCSLSQFSYLTTGVELKAGAYSLEVSGASYDIRVGSIFLAKFTREELMAYQADQIRNGINAIGLIMVDNYAERAVQVEELIADLEAYDAEYGEEGQALIGESTRTTLADAKTNCEKYAQADSAADTIIAQINQIGEITKDNYKDKLASIEAAETAMSDYLAAYGNGCKAFVENYETLTQARESYDAFSSYTLGDINGDGDINASDALLALQHSVKLTTLEGARALAADTNHDEDINASDALLILQYSVELITEFPSAS